MTQEPPRSPVVAFGLHAATSALRARAGGLDEAGRRRLRDLREDLLPERADVAEAVEAFVAGLDVDPAAASDAFLQALARLDGARPIAAMQAMQVEQALQAAGFHWQGRRDING